MYIHTHTYIYIYIYIYITNSEYFNMKNGRKLAKSKSSQFPTSFGRSHFQDNSFSVEN